MADASSLLHFIKLDELMISLRNRLRKNEKSSVNNFVVSARISVCKYSFKIDVTVVVTPPPKFYESIVSRIMVISEKHEFSLF